MLEDLLANGPRFVTLMLTTRCNLGCAYCYQARSRPETMADGVLEAAVACFLRSDHAYPTLAFFGGEPLLEMPLVRRAVEVVRSRKPPWMRPRFRLSTNGLLLDQETATFLADADFQVTLSMDGVPGAQNRRGTGTFETLDRILVRLRREHPAFFLERLSVSITLTSENVRYLAESFRYFLSRDIRDVSVAPVFTHDPGWGPEERAELDRQIAAVADDSRTDLLASSVIAFRPFRDRGGGEAPQASAARLCGAANRREIFVDVDGSIAPCAAMARSCLRDPPPLLRKALEECGDINVTDPHVDRKVRVREEKIEGLLLFDAKAARSSAIGPCPGCPALESCFVCPVSIAWGQGAPWPPNRIPALQCDFNRFLEKRRRQFQESVPDILGAGVVLSGLNSPLVFELEIEGFRSMKE